MKKLIILFLLIAPIIAFGQRSNLSVKNLKVNGQLSTPGLANSNPAVLLVQPGGNIEPYDVADTIFSTDIRNKSLVPGYTLNEALNELFNQDPIQATVFPELSFIYEIRKNGLNYEYKKIRLKFDDFGRLKYFNIDTTWTTITE